MGDDARRVVKAVSSAKSGRPPSGMAWANMYMTKAAFFQGSRCLGEIEIDGGELFRAGGREYRDVSLRRDDTNSGVLRSLVCVPVQRLVTEAQEKEAQNK